MPYFMIVFIPYINLLNLYLIVKCLFLRNMEPLKNCDDFLIIVKERKLRWNGHISRSSDVAKIILQVTNERTRRRSSQGKQKKRWEGDIKDWSGLSFVSSQRAVEDKSKYRNKISK